MKFIIYFLLTITCILMPEMFCLILKDITVPSEVVIKNNDMEPITFDCHWELDNNSSSLVVKWMKDDQAVYQWIRGHEPSVFPDFKENVNETFSKSADWDPENRGLFLMTPTINSTGIYKCIVQTDEATLFMEKKLQIIDLRNYTFKLHHNKIQNETHLECTINHIYPEPIIFITTADDQPISVLTFKSSENDDGFFDASAIAVLRTDEADACEYKCTTSFLGLPFNLTVNVTSGGNAFKHANNNALLFCATLILLSRMVCV